MSKPYDEYVNKVIADSPYVFPDGLTEMEAEELWSMLADAWMDGLKYSLVMIESEKRRRDVQQD